MRSSMPATGAHLRRSVAVEHTPRKRGRCATTLVTGHGVGPLPPHRRPTGIGGNQFNQAIRLEDRLPQRCSEFDPGDAEGNLRTIPMMEQGPRRV